MKGYGGGSGGGGLIGGGVAAGLYTAGGGGLIHQNNNYNNNYQNHHFPQGRNMVQRNGGNGGGGGGGRVFVSNHHHHHQGGGLGPYAALHQSGVLLGHHQGHPGSGGPPHLPHHQNPHHQGLHRPPFQNSHLGHHQFGGINSVGSSHFSSSGSGGSSGIGNGGGSIGGSHASSNGGSSDMPPIESVVARLETASRLLHGIAGNNTRIAEISSEIVILSEDLRRVGSLLENTYPEVLDRVMSSMRDASAQPCLPPSLRLAIFELVELRASKWILPSDSSNYYRQRRNLNDAVVEPLVDERSGRNSASGGSGNVSNAVTSNINNNPNNVSVIVTNCSTGNNGSNNAANPIKPEVIFPPGSPSPGAASVETPATPAKTYREEIVIKNSDSGKVMGVRGRRVHLIESISDTIISFEKVSPTAKERVLSINGYSQQSINLAKQLIQETITRNASPVLEGMVLPNTSSSLGDFQELGMDEVEAGLKRIQINSASSSSVSSHVGNKLDAFTYTVNLGEHSIKILGDDFEKVQEAKIALEDYFVQKYPHLFCSSNSIEEDCEDEEFEDVEDVDFQSQQRYDRETLLSLSKVNTPAPDFCHLDPEIRGNIVLEKRRDFDLEKFTKETSLGSISTGNQQHHGFNSNNNTKAPGTDT